MGKYVAIVLFLLAIALSGCTAVFSPRAYWEHRACLKLKPGMSEKEAVATMGTPREELARSATERVLYYRWLFNDTGPMHVALANGPNGYTVKYVACEGAG